MPWPMDQLVGVCSNIEQFHIKFSNCPSRTETVHLFSTIQFQNLKWFTISGGSLFNSLSSSLLERLFPIVLHFGFIWVPILPKRAILLCLGFTTMVPLTRSILLKRRLVSDFIFYDAAVLWVLKLICLRLR